MSKLTDTFTAQELSINFGKLFEAHNKDTNSSIFRQLNVINKGQSITRQKIRFADLTLTKYESASLIKYKLCVLKKPSWESEQHTEVEVITVNEKKKDEQK